MHLHLIKNRRKKKKKGINIFLKIVTLLLLWMGMELHQTAVELSLGL
jgi:hypothetical protein